MWLYQVLDITATLTESLGLYLFSICFCKEPRYRASVNRWLITGISFLCAYTLTWFSELGALKAPFLLTIYLVLLKVCYRDSVYQCAVAEELNYIATTMLSESIGMLIAHWIYQDQMFVLVDGISLLRWEIYVITLSIRIVSFFVIYIICRKFRYRISPKDFLPLTGIFVVAFLPFVFNAFQHLNIISWILCKHHIFCWVVPRFSDIRYCFPRIQVAAFRYNSRPRHYIRKIIFSHLCTDCRVCFHAYACVCTFPGVAYIGRIPHPFYSVNRRAYLGMDSGSS